MSRGRLIGKTPRAAPGRPSSPTRVTRPPRAKSRPELRAEETYSHRSEPRGAEAPNPDWDGGGEHRVNQSPPSARPEPQSYGHRTEPRDPEAVRPSGRVAEPTHRTR